MRIPQGLGFDLTNGVNLAIVLVNGNVLQGTLLAVVGDRNMGYYPPIPPNQQPRENNTEFLLLQLTCAFASFPEGTIIAVNVEQIQLIGPDTFTCID
ncbi:hypothetical protein SPFL3102_00723 [Sporomusaceae bacterium FL31]|nr:hypothetical protein SPFL3101_00565 [Sporomusaceae bacterium FL31]GCE32922.1 hypothetical protein SPFL3102_00723 [Sporomusaceae bacterium]